MEDVSKTKIKKKKGNRALRIFGRLLAVLILLILLLILFIRSPWGQDIIINKTVNYISEKTQTRVEIEKFFLTFDGDLQLEGLFLEDTKGDTLVYSKSLEADIALWPLIKGDGIGIDALDWEGLRANIYRKDTIAGYNFQFLIDAFAPTSPNTPADATEAPPNIKLGTLLLKDADVNFVDEVVGIDSKFVIGEIELALESIDLENMAFKASEGFVKNSRIKFHQNPVPIDPNAEEVPLPLLAIEKLTLTNVIADYASLGEGISAQLNIDSFFAEIPKADLAANVIDIKSITMSNSKIAIQANTDTNSITETASEIVDDAKTDIEQFEWPTMRLEVGMMDLSQNEISYRVNNALPTKGTFNPNAVFLDDFSLKTSNLYLKDSSFGLSITNTGFKEASGLYLKELGIDLVVTNQLLTAENISLALNENSLNGRLQLDYDGMSELIAEPESAKVDLTISSFKADLNEVFQFQPSLKNNEYFVTLSKKPLTGNIRANGYLTDIKIPNARVNWGNRTKIVANGLLRNATNPDNLKFDFRNVGIVTSRFDLLKFLSEEELGVKLPEDIAVKGSIKGAIDDLATNLKLTSSQGTATLKGTFQNKNQLSFNAEFELEEYRLDQLLQNEQFGAISLELKGEGSGTTINTLDANVSANISNFNLNEYAITDLAIDGIVKNGRGKIDSKYKDDNLNIDLNALVVLDSVSPEAEIDLNVIGANLQALGLMDRDVRTGLKLQANFKGNSTEYDVQGSIIDGVVVYDNHTYLLGGFDAKAYVRKDTTSLFVKNKMLDFELESNTDPQTFGTALQEHVYSYFYRDAKITDSILDPVRLRVKGTVSQAPLLKEVFLVNIEELDTVSFVVDFNEKARQLKANVNAPHINYAGNVMDSLAFSMDTDQDNFNFDLGFREINAGPFAIKTTTLSGKQINNELNLEFLSYDGDEKLMHVQSQITGSRERLKFQVLPEDLILNKNSWNIPSSNEVVYTENSLQFTDFKINENGQSIELTDKLPNINKEHIAIIYDGFNLREVLDYLNPDERFAEGVLNGELIVENPFADAGVVADLTIDNLEVMEVEMGRLTMDAQALGGSQYDLNVGVKGGEVSFDLKGDYVADNDGANLDFDLDLINFNMRALEGFTQGEVNNANGRFTGKFNVSGRTEDPQYSGALNFDDATFKIAKLNTAFTLPKEKLNIDNKGLSMNSFTVLDEIGNKLVVSGSIGTEKLINPKFDLSIKAENFQILNAAEDDNDFLYGKAAFNADAKLTGDLQIPKLNAKATVSSSTDLTYVMPSAAVNIEDRDGVVVFVNRENPDAILTNTEEQTATVNGFDIAALIHVGSGAKVKIIIDEETGDNLQVSGEGDLNFTMKPNGRMNLVGAYNISGGHYEMNLYNLVNRKFELVEGSRVSWSGDPFDAKLDVKALYKVEASASALMAAQTSGSDPSVKSKFRQVLPFYVYLSVDGELMQPKISFNLDMPEDDQGAIGGQVYGRIQQLNQQESELNKQVFSLLVLNRFYPEPGSDGSRGGAATIARDNINDALSDQLNVFSDKLLGDTGVELDFGLDSYTDYQGDSPTERTQLDIAAQKKLFNDRLVVRVGSEVDLQGSSSSGEATPLIGNVSLEYMLTENGRYRLKGFRRNEFENVIDGQTIASGIALIFTQEFNRFSELRDAIFLKGSSEEDSRNEKKEKENEEVETNKKAIDPEDKGRTDNNDN